MSRDLRGSPRLRRVLGTVLLLHFLAVCAVKIGCGLAGEILWMSHIGLLLTAYGLLSNRPLLLATALVDVLVLHGLWLADFLVWRATGAFPLGVTRYLVTATGWTWLATAHHFYLVPLLLALVRRRAVRAPETLLAAIAMYLLLTVLSRALVPPALNVNFAYGVPTATSVPLVAWGNLQPGAVYLPALNAFVALFMFTPVYLLLRARQPACA